LGARIEAGFIDTREVYVAVLTECLRGELLLSYTRFHFDLEAGADWLNLIQGQNSVIRTAHSCKPAAP